MKHRAAILRLIPVLAAGTGIYFVLDRHFPRVVEGPVVPLAALGLAFTAVLIFVGLPEEITGLTREKLAPRNVVREVFKAMVVALLYELWSQRAHPSRRAVAKPPGHALEMIAEFFLHPRTVERLVKPALADLQHEYFEALARGRRWKACWVRLRGNAALISALGLYGIARSAYALWRNVRIP